MRKISLRRSCSSALSFFTVVIFIFYEENLRKLLFQKSNKFGSKIRHYYFLKRYNVIYTHIFVINNAILSVEIFINDTFTDQKIDGVKAILRFSGRRIYT